MSIVKVIEIIASSPKSWDAAAANTVAEASKTIKDIKHFYVESQTAIVDNGKIIEYRINGKISFVVKD